MIVAGKLMAPVRIDFTYKKAVIVITIICIVIRHIIVITMTAFCILRLVATLCFQSFNTFFTYFLQTLVTKFL